MSCCAVGICEITDLNSRIEQRATSNSPASNMASTLSAISSALTKPSWRLTSRKSTRSTILSLAEVARRMS
jgi:hypothetical protein